MDIMVKQGRVNPSLWHVWTKCMIAKFGPATTRSIFTISVILFAAFIPVACVKPDPRLTEQALRESFIKNEKILNKLVEMQYQDPKVNRIAHTFTRLGWDNRLPGQDMGISEARWNEYKALFNAAGLEEGMQAWDIGSGHGGVAFSIYLGVGYYFIEDPSRDENQLNKHVFNSFNECVEKKPKIKGSCLVPIRKNWYLNSP